MLLLYCAVVVITANNVLAKPIEDYMNDHGLAVIGKEEFIGKENPMKEQEERQINEINFSVHSPRDLNFTSESYSITEVDLHLDSKKNHREKARYTRQAYQAPIGQGPYLLFANRIYLVQLQNVPELDVFAFRGPANAVAVDFDKRKNYMFWSDVATRAIYRAREDGSEFTILISTNITTPDGIAWDWVNMKLYWTDAGDYDLEVYDPSTNYREVLVQNGNTSRPRAIIVDPCTGYMYWSDWGQPATIERAMLDGSNRIILHNTNLVWPNAMTMDYETQTLYWMDGFLRRLESSNADGSNRMLLSTLHIYHPFSMVFYNNSLFWSDWQVKEVRSAEISQLNTVYIVMTNLTHEPMGMTVVAIERQRIMCDECAENIDNCDSNANCTNTPGSFTCTCNPGYTGDGVTCDDIDECAENIDNCDSNAVCTNTPGSFTCTCNPGYTGDGVTCYDIDECAENIDNCDSNAVCTNTPGSFTCTCNPGYSRDGVTCEDIDECTENIDNCHSNAVCTNTPGSFTCTCNSGYTGDGVTCDDIDECAVNIDNCHSNAVCTNTLGSFTCTCNSGYSGDGVTCKVICVVGFENTNLTLHENEGSDSVCVKILQDCDLVNTTGLQINLSTSHITTDGNDFSPVTASISLSQSVRSKCVDIDITYDYLQESLEMFTVMITAIEPSSYLLLNPSRADVTIVDVKRYVNVVVGFELEQLEVSEDINKVNICVVSSHPIGSTIKIQMHMSEDYSKDAVIPTNELVFGNSDQACISINIINDNTEGDRNVVLTLDLVSVEDTYLCVTLNVSMMEILIKDMDRSSHKVGFEETLIEVDATQTKKIDICVSGDSIMKDTDQIALLADTHDGSAVAGEHYRGLPNFYIGLSKSNRHHCFTCRILNDFNGTKTFTVSLRSIFSTVPITIEPKVALIRICSGNDKKSECITDVNKTEWTSTGSSTDVPHNICYSGKAFTATRQKSSSEQELGQFCTKSQEERIVESFNLGLSCIRCGRNESEPATCLSNATILTRKKDHSQLPDRCTLSRPERCSNRSILFVLDTSNSVGPENFKIMTSAVSEFTKHLCGNVKVAVVKFNQHTFLDICFDCITDNNPLSLSRYISNITYETSGQEEADIVSTMQRINEHLFNDSCGDHSNSDCIDIVYITNRQFNIDKGSSAGIVLPSHRLGLPLHDSICNKTRVYAIGIGTNVDIDELKCIADIEMETPQDTVFQFDSFVDFRKAVSRSVQYIYRKKKCCDKVQCNQARIDIKTV